MVTMGRSGFLYRMFSVSLIIPLLTILITSTARTQDNTVPGDLKIELSSAPMLPDPRFGPETAIIHADGRTELSGKWSSEGELLPTEARLDAAAMLRIYQAIVAERFFELEPRYEDPAVMDGDYANMTVTANGQSYSVRTVNIKVHAFDRIVLAIDRELPAGRRIIYNALHVESYSAVER